MKLFSQIVRTIVNVALLPVDIAKDVIMSPLDYGEDRPVGERTRDRIDTLKDEANED